MRISDGVQTCALPIYHQIACKPNGKSRKNEVDADGKGELKAGQQKRCLGIWHEDWLPWRFPMGGSIAGAPEIAAPYNFRVGMPMIRFPPFLRSEEHTSELQSLMRISYAVFCLKKKTNLLNNINTNSSETSNNNHKS